MAKAPELNPNITNSALVSKQNSDDSNAEDLDYSNAENTTDDSSDANFDVISAESSDEDSSVENEEKDSVSVKSDFKSNSRGDNETSNRKLKNPIEKSDKNIDYKILPNKPLETDVKNGFERSKKSPMSTNLKNKVHEKMVAAKFRYLNEKLYTETGRESFQYFNKNTDEFDDYHLGYRQQVSKWPMNPVNEIISDLQKLKKNITIADLGCGEAKIAQVLKNITVHSFDLVPLNEYVKSCDISKVPLPNESVDVAVFCLSLMGVNLKDYLREAFRILKVGGILKIAEVESRIDDLEHFINYLEYVGFKLEKKNTKHKMFVFLDLKKEKKQSTISEKFPEWRCLYIYTDGSATGADAGVYSRHFSLSRAIGKHYTNFDGEADAVHMAFIN
ncbi:ribosomal RNA-processing protein 8 [Nephila pilipes]|uniref:Ribosomal RNA-processing protein 8 n=1 Tax=Nephila pilipes TaxID=299642 RepID=A0A8X6T9U9_NEPPI|nr:ribosomal RNA-processing protein 8 [Nephila pilipes]